MNGLLTFAALTGLVLYIVTVGVIGNRIQDWLMHNYYPGSVVGPWVWGTMMLIVVPISIVVGITT